jgi:hypothetical protein
MQLDVMHVKPQIAHSSLRLLLLLPHPAGEGAYGQVYLGLNQETGELMAVKTLPLVGRRGSKELDTQLQELKQVGWGCWGCRCRVP